MTKPLLVVHVQIRVLPAQIDAFLEATRENARASRKEPGIARFDVVQDRDDPTRFAYSFRGAMAPLPRFSGCANAAKVRRASAISAVEGAKMRFAASI